MKARKTNALIKKIHSFKRIYIFFISFIFFLICFTNVSNPDVKSTYDINIDTTHANEQHNKHTQAQCAHTRARIMCI